MRTIFTEERFAAARSPLDRSEQQSVTITQREQFLLSAGAETLFADYISAFVFQKRRGHNFCRAGRTRVDQDNHRSTEEGELWIGFKSLKHFLLAADCFRD